MASAPAANFLLIILLTIKGILSIVPVKSLNAYNFLSAGARSEVGLIIDAPTFLTISINLFRLNSVLNPLIDSNLSIVPPV